MPLAGAVGYNGGSAGWASRQSFAGGTPALKAPSHPTVLRHGPRPLSCELQVEDGVLVRDWASCHALEEKNVTLYFQTVISKLAVSIAVQAGRARGPLVGCGNSWSEASSCTEKEVALLLRQFISLFKK